MPSFIKKAIICSLLAAGIVGLGGCGDSDRTTTFDPETSAHPADWLPAKHAAEANQNLGSCRQCHGDDLASGGISNVSCNACHIGGPTAVHPETYDGRTWLQGGHGRYISDNGIASCRNMWCHGTNLQGVAQSGPSCDECHSFP